MPLFVVVDFATCSALVPAFLPSPVAALPPRGFDSLPFLSGIARAAAAAPSLTVSSDELICGHNGGGCIVGRGLIYQGGEDRRETRSLGLKRDGLPNHRVTDRWIGM